MSCKVWNELASAGEALLREESPERLRAEQHLAVCSSCAERAFLLDPSWAVRRSFGQVFEASEITELKRSVTKAGRLLDIERTVAPRRRWVRAAAIAVLVAMAAVAGIVSSRTDSARTETQVQVPEAPRPVRLSADGVDASLPVIGSLAPAAARVYELGEEEFALVMVVHETLDL